MPLKNQSSKFSLSRDHTYLNCAYMSPLLKSVEKAGLEGIKMKRSPGKVKTEDFFTTTDRVRTAYGKLIQAPAQQIALIPSVSYGMAAVLKNLTIHSSQNIIVAEGQFPSNVYPWMRLQADTGARVHFIEAPPTKIKRGQQWNDRIVESIQTNTRLVALGNIHWADGTIFDLEAIRKRTREVGAWLVIDGTQSVGALPFDVRKIQPEALICAGYKWLMGPYATGVAYFSPELNKGVPVEENWINRLHSENFVGLVKYQSDYQPGALRYDVGERSNFILTPMLLAALRQVQEWKPANIQAYCDRITQREIARLRSYGFWIEEDVWRSKHLFGIRLPDQVSLADVQKKLAKEKISVSFRGDAIRVSPHVYNTEKDIKKLADVLITSQRS